MHLYYCRKLGLWFRVSGDYKFKSHVPWLYCRIYPPPAILGS